jgi:hypothetical protein
VHQSAESLGARLGAIRIREYCVNFMRANVVATLELLSEY